VHSEVFTGFDLAEMLMDAFYWSLSYSLYFLLVTIIANLPSSIWQSLLIWYISFLFSISRFLLRLSSQIMSW